MSVALRGGKTYNRPMSDNSASPDLPGKDAYMGELRQALGDLERLLSDEDATDEVPDSRPMSARAALELQARQSGMAQASFQPSVVAQAAPVPQPTPAAEQEDSRELQLLIRFVVGALILAGEELAARARRWEASAPAQGRVAPGGAALDEASYLELARYWTLGALAYARRSGVGALRAALRGPEGMAPALFDLTDRATSLIFLRPLRAPMKRALRQAQNTSRDWINEGWREEQLSRWIAQNGAPEILDDIIAIISKNPELADLVRKQINQQSMSVAASVVESGRKLSSVGDDAAETFVRRLLRLGPRAEGARVVPYSELRPEETAARPNDEYPA